MHARYDRPMSATCHNPRVTVEEAREQTVADVMLTRPKTLPTQATVADLRRVFENRNVVTTLLVDGDRYVTSVERNAVTESLDGAAAALTVAAPGETIHPDAPMSEALARLEAGGGRRLVVVEGEGRLTGLLCLGSGRNAFCR